MTGNSLFIESNLLTTQLIRKITTWAKIRAIQTTENDKPSLGKLNLTLLWCFSLIHVLSINMEGVGWLPILQPATRRCFGFTFGELSCPFLYMSTTQTKQKESIMFPTLGNSVEPLSENLISIFDQSIFCMKLPQSLWFDRFCTILKVCTVHKLTWSH